MKTKLILDINKKQHAQLNSIVTGRVGDRWSNTVDVYVIDNGVPYNITGMNVIFECAKPDNTVVRDDKGVKMIDAAKGHFEYTFPTETFGAIGKAKQAFMSIEKDTTIRATTQDFVLITLPDAITNRIPSESYVSDLEKLINELNEMALEEINSQAAAEASAAKFFANQANELSISIQKQLNEIVINGDSSVESAQARIDDDGYTYQTLKERIDAEQKKIKSLSNKNKRIVSLLDFEKYKVAIAEGFDWTKSFEEAFKTMKEGYTLIVPSGDLYINPKSPFLVDHDYHVIGAGKRATKITVLGDKTVFQTAKKTTSRTYYFSIEHMQIVANKNISQPVFDLTGGSYFTISQIILSGNEGAEQFANAIIFPKGMGSFNGYIELDYVYIQGFNYGVWGEGNNVTIKGGFYNGNKQYGIYITPGNVISVTNIEASRNKKGGIFLEGNGLFVDNNWYEYNGNRINEVYSPNNVEIGITSRNIHIGVSQRQDYSNAGIVHGQQEDYGYDYNSGIGNAHNSSYGMISNGNFDYLDGNGVPYGWRAVGNLAFSYVSDGTTPSGYGNGLKIISTSGIPKFFQSIFTSNNEIKKYKGKRITSHMYVRLNADNPTDLPNIRFGITKDPLTSGGLSFGSFLTGQQVTIGKWIKYTLKYDIIGDENQINVGFQLQNASSIEITGVTGIIGDLNLANHEKAVTSAGGDIWTQEFKIGGRRHGFGTTAPTSGDWRVGDIVYNTIPASGGFVGWVCIATGTPGTWRTFGAISSI
ncbi:BppU family phage baseplate upper protein [Bacillus sp. BB56-3]|uniref:BppU family phage baseplate upper protein n=1 Tax=Bacillus sp. BB56-3 TaxID=2217831 RepID=UPI0021085369|nr:BppU family phage baseplate upper protein [Bacillus sp. BB56-3]